MYSGRDAANTAYPTQWALNPTAYQNVDTSHVDWAALAQQWIAMKEAAAIVAAPPPPALRAEEEGEAPMEVENPDNNSDGPPGAEWNSTTNSWGGSWNQWGWGWSGSGPVEPKIPPDPAIGIPPIVEGYTVPPETAAPIPGYTTGTPAPTFQHGYWTAPQVEQNNSRSSSSSRDRRSKSKNREHKPSRTSRSQRDKAPAIPPVIEPIVMPTTMVTSTIDAAKRRQLPAWIREGLEKMEREKQKAIEREQELKAREEAEKEKKRLEEEELERMKAEAGGQPVMPPKSKFFGNAFAFPLRLSLGDAGHFTYHQVIHLLVCRPMRGRTTS
uniref:SFRICE_029127 n=1 Tax=Spodoptera frugiperda TaxID=7108 RepID=A0A2H1VSN1_SPOFR